MIEVNTIIPLFEDYGIHGAYIKVVGTSFRNMITLSTGQATLKEFFNKLQTKSIGRSRGLEGAFSRIETEGIKWAEDLQKTMNELIKIERQPNNPYDHNAIAVYVNYVNRFTKVGYFPKDLAEIVVTKKFKYYIVGFEKSGRGIMLTMIFNSPEIPVVEFDPRVTELREDKSLGFMSLNKIRKRLCIR